MEIPKGNCVVWIEQAQELGMFVLATRPSRTKVPIPGSWMEVKPGHSICFDIPKLHPSLKVSPQTNKQLNKKTNITKQKYKQTKSKHTKK